MKRKIAWLALPLVLCALMFAAKWRAEHPTPTKEDLAIRALMEKSFLIEVTFVNRRADTTLSKEDLKPFIDSFYLAQSRMIEATADANLVNLGFYFRKPTSIDAPDIGVNVYLHDYIGAIATHLNESEGAEKDLAISPITVKRWRELLLNHPQIGPEVRARMKKYERP